MLDGTELASLLQNAPARYRPLLATAAFALMCGIETSVRGGDAVPFASTRIAVTSSSRAMTIIHPSRLAATDGLPLNAGSGTGCSVRSAASSGRPTAWQSARHCSSENTVMAHQLSSPSQR